METDGPISTIRQDTELAIFYFFNLSLPNKQINTTTRIRKDDEKNRFFVENPLGKKLPRNQVLKISLVSCFQPDATCLLERRSKLNFNR